MNREREAVAAACRAARAMHGLSQPALAERTGLSEALIRKIEAGERSLSETEALRVCNATGLQISEWALLQEVYSNARARVERLAS